LGLEDLGADLLELTLQEQRLVGVEVLHEHAALDALNQLLVHVALPFSVQKLRSTAHRTHRTRRTPGTRGTPEVRVTRGPRRTRAAARADLAHGEAPRAALEVAHSRRLRGVGAVRVDAERALLLVAGRRVAHVDRAVVGDRDLVEHERASAPQHAHGIARSVSDAARGLARVDERDPAVRLRDLAGRVRQLAGVFRGEDNP